MSWNRIDGALLGEVRGDGQVQVRLAGEIDLANADQLERYISGRLDEDCRSVTVDLSRVTFFDAQGIRLLVRLKAKLDEARCALRLQYPNRVVRRVLECTHDDDVFEIGSAGSSVVAPSNLDDVREIITHTLEAALLEDRSDTGSAQLADPATGVLELIASPGFDSNFSSFFEVVHEEEGASCAVAAANRSVQIVQDVAASPIFVDTPSLDVMMEADARSCISIPVFAGSEQLVGMFSVHHDHRRDWEPERMRALQDLAAEATRELDALTAS